MQVFDYGVRHKTWIVFHQKRVPRLSSLFITSRMILYSPTWTYPRREWCRISDNHVIDIFTITRNTTVSCQLTDEKSAGFRVQGTFVSQHDWPFHSDEKKIQSCRYVRDSCGSTGFCRPFGRANQRDTEKLFNLAFDEKTNYSLAILYTAATRHGFQIQIRTILFCSFDESNHATEGRGLIRWTRFESIRFSYWTLEGKSNPQIRVFFFFFFNWGFVCYFYNVEIQLGTQSRT